MDQAPFAIARIVLERAVIARAIDLECELALAAAAAVHGRFLAALDRFADVRDQIEIEERSKAVVEIAGHVMAPACWPHASRLALGRHHSAIRFEQSGGATTRLRLDESWRAPFVPGAHRADESCAHARACASIGLDRVPTRGPAARAPPGGKGWNCGKGQPAALLTGRPRPRLTRSILQSPETFQRPGWGRSLCWRYRPSVGSFPVPRQRNPDGSFLDNPLAATRTALEDRVRLRRVGLAIEVDAETDVTGIGDDEAIQRGLAAVASLLGEPVCDPDHPAVIGDPQLGRLR